MLAEQVGTSLLSEVNQPVVFWTPGGMAARVSDVEQVSQPVFGESLADFLRESRVGGVEIEWVEPKGVPAPYRGLLVHRGDMTSILEEFHGEELELEILRVMEDDGHYFREVVLRTEGSGAVVEYGVIEVVLPAFSASMRVAITEGKQPLGA
jgi:hypothetical protein